MSPPSSAAARRYLTKSLFQTATTCPRKLRYATQPNRYPRRVDPLLTSLAQEGRKFELYCRTRHFDGGTLVGGGAGSASVSASSASSSTSHDGRFGDSSSGNGNGLEFASSASRDIHEAIVEDWVEQTRALLLREDRHPGESAIFEGAVRYQDHLIRADVLRRSSNDLHDSVQGGRETISLIEIKAKSWNSASIEAGENPIVGKRGGIKSSFAPYLNDVAYQKWVVEQAYPEFDVRAFLMMPDKGKRTSATNLNRLMNDILYNTKWNKVEMDATKLITEARSIVAEDDIAALVDVTELADRIIHEKLLKYPGSPKKGVSLDEAARKWAHMINMSDGEDSHEADEQSSLVPPIGTQCKSCEFKVGMQGASDTLSGFDVCWKEATGLEPDAFQDGSTVVDLWHGSKTKVADFIAKGKYRLADLDNEDLGFSEDGIELKKKGKKSSPKLGMSRSQRQLYQAKGLPSPEGVPYLLDDEYLEDEMKSWNFPYHFIDFETTAPALPYFPGMAPFSTMAFQFSHHMLHEDGRVEHASQFLHAEQGICPNEGFLRALAESIGGCNGTVFRWGAHENTILAVLLESHEGEIPSDISNTLSPLLQDGDRPMVDLNKCATLGYYVVGSDGSSSIKKLLSPTLEASSFLEEYYGKPTYSSSNFKNMQWYQRYQRIQDSANANDKTIVRDPYEIIKEYENASQNTMKVTDGGAAITAFSTLQCNDLSPDKRSALESSLLRYCELDTLAMAMIVQAWRGFLEDI